jgi:1-acyl-sn-glycerol-3-phosphate acyltransferase
LVKKGFLNIGYFKHLMEFGNVICVDQEKVGKEFLASVKKTLKEGNILGIFPEGKR